MALATEKCTEMTFDECDEGLPFKTLKDITPESCQTDWCANIFGGTCTFFIYDREHELCELFDTPIDDYVSTCDILGGPFGLDLQLCADSNDPCDVR